VNQKIPFIGLTAIITRGKQHDSEEGNEKDITMMMTTTTTASSSDKWKGRNNILILKFAKRRNTLFNPHYYN
jgi:hypothetical protein